jgi:hypothetical protein
VLSLLCRGNPKISLPAAAKAEVMNARWKTSRRGCSVLSLLCRGNPKISLPAAAKAEVMNAHWETSRRGWPMFCNGGLLQDENVSRLNMLVSCPTARQRDRLKTLLLPSVSPPRNPRADPANKFQKSVSQFTIGNPKISRIFKSHGTVFVASGLKILERHSKYTVFAFFNREANDSLVLRYKTEKLLKSPKRGTPQPPPPGAAPQMAPNDRFFN